MADTLSALNPELRPEAYLDRIRARAEAKTAQIAEDRRALEARLQEQADARATQNRADQSRFDAEQAARDQQNREAFSRDDELRYRYQAAVDAQTRADQRQTDETQQRGQLIDIEA